jgi:hypothetical protein
MKVPVIGSMPMRYAKANASYQENTFKKLTLKFTAIYTISISMNLRVLLPQASQETQ